MIVFRAIPFGTTPEPLSPQGTKQLTDAYDAYFAGPLGPLVKANSGDFFVDSHASDPWGAPEELWSIEHAHRVPGARGLRHRAATAGAVRHRR